MLRGLKHEERLSLILGPTSLRHTISSKREPQVTVLHTSSKGRVTRMRFQIVPFSYRCIFKSSVPFPCKQEVKT